MRDFKKRIQFWLPVLLWMGVIFAFSSKQKVALTDSYTLSFLIFKLLHLIEYAFLFLVSYRAIRNTTKRSNTQVKIIAFIMTILFAITDEIHQTYVPTREGKLRDVIIDGIGGGIGWIGISILLQRARGKLKILLLNWQLKF